MSETVVGTLVETEAKPLTGQAYWDDWALTELRNAVRPGRYDSLYDAFNGYAAALVRFLVDGLEGIARETTEMQMRGLVAAEKTLTAEAAS